MRLAKKFPIIYPKLDNDVFSELCIGVYPDIYKTNQFRDIYCSTYDPNFEPSTPETWLKIWGECITPFSISNKDLEIIDYFNDRLVIYVFDLNETIDVFDFWNMRIAQHDILPVPIQWFSNLAGQLTEWIKDYEATIRLSSSITEEKFTNEYLPFLSGVSENSFSFQIGGFTFWRTDCSKKKGVALPNRVKLSVSEIRKTISVSDINGPYIEYDSISPKFADMYSLSNRRWSNVVTISDHANDTNIALNLPYSVFDEDWFFPKGGIYNFTNSREGWVFQQRFKNLSQPVKLLNNETAFSIWFKLRGIKVELSYSGRIAKQMLESLGGFWGLCLFDDEEPIRLINSMANSIRKRKNGDEELEEEFLGKTATIKQWVDMIKIRQETKKPHDIFKLSDYIDRNVIQLGLETDCSYCNKGNWHSLEEVSYKVKCDCCLKQYDFPQGSLKRDNQNWKYKAIGPFSIPDYAAGAYTALLSMRFFSKFFDRSQAATYSPAMNIVDHKVEIDFVIWASDENVYDAYEPPVLIIGEAKSFAEEAITKDDLQKLMEAAELMSPSVLVISVLKTKFSEQEKSLLKEFVEWAREPINSKPRYWVILLTGTELFSRLLGSTWKEKGEPFSNFTRHHHIYNLQGLSDATLSIYLNLPSYNQIAQQKRQKN